MLYLDHFGLDEAPFRITPHTDFFFDGADRGATLEALLYAILHDEGIVKVSGEVGSGKTMLCRVLMERLPEYVEIVYLANPSLARDEILQTIANDLDLVFSQERVTVALRELEDHLIEFYGEGRRVVILIDEAHAMPEDTLEQVRLLSNLESNRHKLLQIVLFGQPELDEVLNKPSMRQLKDRITHSFRMRPLSSEEIGNYLIFRMRAAGYRGPDIFTRTAVTAIARGASGLTRRVNILADKALLAAFTENKHLVTTKEVRTAVRDSEFGRLLNEKRPGPLILASTALIGALALGALLHWIYASSQDPRQSAAATASSMLPRAAPPKSASSLDAGESARVTVQPQSSESNARAGTTNVQPAIAEQGGPARAIVPITPAEVPKAVTESRVESTLGAEAIRRVSAYQTGPNKLLKARIHASLERLGQEPASSLSIELFSTDNSDPARVERFLIRARELVALEDIIVLPQFKGGRYRIQVAYGGYADRNSAALALERLPQKYKQAFQPEFRSFAELREAL